jgi:phospholipase/carboxylesterase
MIEFMHRFVPASDAYAPTLLALHGTGGDENDLIPLARQIHPGAAILSPRGRVLERGMPRFFARLAEGVFDREDLARRTVELADFIAGAAERYGFDPRRLYAVGYSNGANIAASVLFARPESLAGGVLFRAMVPFEPEPLPDLTAKAVFISAGRTDEMVPAPNTQRLADLLTRAGAKVTLAWQQSGHGLVPHEVDQAAAWFVRAAERP